MSRIGLYDTSLDKAGFMNNPEDRDIMQIPGGCNLTYFDINSNKRQDGSDSLRAEGIEPGDKITVVYKPTGGHIATWTCE